MKRACKIFTSKTMINPDVHRDMRVPYDTFKDKQFNRMKFSFLIIVLTVLQLSAHNLVAQTPVEEYGQLAITGSKMVDHNGNEVQLRGMSLYWSQWQGSFYTYNTVKWLRDDWKCEIVRAAMGVQNGGYMTSPEKEMQKVKTVIDAAIDLGVYVIVDWHSHTALNGSEPEEASRFFAEIARTYGNQPNIIYEIFNEPLNDVTWTNLKPYHEHVLDSIRAYDPSNIVICGTATWSQDVDQVVASPITNYKNVAYALHFYAATHKEYLRAKALKALNANLCIFAAEWGVCSADGNGTIDLASTMDWIDFMDKHKISWCNWAVSLVNEAASALKDNASPNGNWEANQLTTSGEYIRTELIAKYQSKHNQTGFSQFSNSIECYPNPASDIVRIKAPQKTLVKLYSQSRLLNSFTVDDTLEFSMSDLPAGIYFLQFNQNNQVVTKKIGKE